MRDCREGVENDLEQLWSIEPLEFSPVVREAVAAGAEAAGVDARHVVSGAGHDASYMAQFTDAGMVFVPSVDGITHAEAEFTDWDDCVAGAEVYPNAALELANGLLTTRSAPTRTARGSSPPPTG